MSNLQSNSQSSSQPISQPRPKLSRRAFLKFGVRSAIGINVLGLGSLGYASKIENGWIDVNPVRLTLPRLAPEFNGYRVAQISDLHMDYWMTRRRLSHIVELINEQQPDAVAITGDFVTYQPQKFAPDLVAALKALSPRDAAVAVLGNHDHWTNPAVIRRAIRDSGLVDLNNKVHTLRRGAAALHLAGLDDPWMKKDRLDVVLKAMPEAGADAKNSAAILLAHEPDFADRFAACGRFDLQLSGHSHGGQVVFPFMKPRVLPLHGRKYPSGPYQIGSMILYTNRGVGMVGPHVRFNCRPEITIFTLETSRT